MLDRDGRLVGNRLQQFDFLRRKHMRRRGIAVDHSNGLLPDHHRNGQQRAEPFLLGHVGIHVVGIFDHVGDDDRPPLLYGTPTDTLPDLEIRLAPIELAQALSRFNSQIAGCLVQQHDGTNLGVHHLGGHGHQQLQDVFDQAIGGDCFRHLGQRFDLQGLLPHLLVESSVFDRPAHLVGDGRQQRQFIGAVAFRALMLHVDYTDHFFLRHDRNRHERLMPVLGQIVKELEP